MTNVLSRFRSRVVARDSEPLQSLLFAWASKRGKAERLSYTQERLLESVNEAPCLNRGDRTQRLGWSIKKFQETKGILEELGLVRTEQIAHGLGRPETFLVLTEQGFKYLRKQHIQPNQLHGSVQHHCAILSLKDRFERLGYATQVTAPVGGDAVVDLLCTRGNERGAVEVVNSSNAPRDAAKCATLVDALDWVHLIATTQDLFSEYVARFAKLASPEILSKVQISFLPDFLSASAVASHPHQMASGESRD